MMNTSVVCTAVHGAETLGLTEFQKRSTQMGIHLNSQLKIKIKLIIFYQHFEEVFDLAVLKLILLQT